MAGRSFGGGFGGGGSYGSAFGGRAGAYGSDQAADAPRGGGGGGARFGGSSGLAGAGRFERDRFGGDTGYSGAGGSGGLGGGGGGGFKRSFGGGGGGESSSRKSILDQEIKDLVREGKMDEAQRKIQEYMEKFANEEHDEPPIQTKRRWAKPEDRPININGHVIPKEDALLMQLVINNKASLKAQLDVCKQAIVGLDHVVEYIDPEGVSPRVYNCKLCSTWRTAATVIEHVTGFKHRILYIRLHYPNQARTFLLPDGKTPNRIRPLVQLAGLRANELEMVYGRGDFTTVHEKPDLSSTDVDQDDEDLIFSEGETTAGLKKIHDRIKDIRLECDEDINVAKQIINALTDAIIEYRNAPK